MSENRDDIDWSLTTWEGSRRAQLRHVDAGAHARRLRGRRRGMRAGAIERGLEQVRQVPELDSGAFGHGRLVAQRVVQLTDVPRPRVIAEPTGEVGGEALRGAR